HGGWIGALLAGGLTWAAATWLIEISGASRELTEGFGSVFAALVLVSVGIWMHGKAQADHWQRYIREKMSSALSGRSAWLLFGLAFLVVYREVFETILFFAALWSQGNGAAMLAGAGSASVLLALIAMGMLRFSRRLPIATFFRWSAWLMAVLAVVLAGKGVAALQEAGMVGVTQLSVVPRLGLFGLFPTVQTTLAQALTLLALLAGFAWNRRGTQHA
ncbi:partial Ferrous iron permease EfeU, partial [uncultured bacterium]